jgi:hypothetical protein
MPCVEKQKESQAISEHPHINLPQPRFGSMNNYCSEQNDALSVGQPWGKWRSIDEISVLLASRNLNTGNNSKPMVSKTDSMYSARESELTELFHWTFLHQSISGFFLFFVSIKSFFYYDLNMRTTSKKLISRTLPLDFVFFTKTFDFFY